jgi:large conductance mechanosensitive channel
MFAEFRQFIARGSVVDLAVGVIIGAAFTSVVNSLVKDIIMPPIGKLTGGIDFSNLFFVLGSGSYASLADAQKAGAATINYGLFINTVISFLIVAFVIFILVKQVNRVYRQEEEAPAAPPAPTKSEALLEEIRDLLRSR